MAQQTYYSAGISVSDRFKKPTVGLAFLNGFDWLIDYDRHKLYFRKNNTPLVSSNIFVREYRADFKGGNLVITAKKAKLSAFAVGDIIESVNGNSVTAENGKDWLKLLNDAPDWQRFDIQIRH